MSNSEIIAILIIAGIVIDLVIMYAALAISSEGYYEELNMCFTKEGGDDGEEDSASVVERGNGF